MLLAVYVKIDPNFVVYNTAAVPRGLYYQIYLLLLLLYICHANM